jgi:hypothetical protein
MWLWRVYLDDDSELEGRWFGRGVLGRNNWQMCWEVIETLMAVWKMQAAMLVSGAGACSCVGAGWWCLCCRVMSDVEEMKLAHWILLSYGLPLFFIFEVS